MVLFEDQECGVCYLRYSRNDRVPRMLHCDHTFCTPCLETMGLYNSGLRTVRCPLCRQVTCVDHGLSLQEALFVDSQLWDSISDNQEEGEDEREREKEEEGNNCEIKELPSSQAKSPVPKQHRPKLRLPTFLKKIRFARHPEERIVPRCNVHKCKSCTSVRGELLIRYSTFNPSQLLGPDLFQLSRESPRCETRLLEQMASEKDFPRF